ncbi:MAG: N-acyl homoserine lactonase family protein [Actinomycetota bacterium]|jgi:N-acyl homoserine lactone hydrolase
MKTVNRMWALDAPVMTLDASMLMVGGHGPVTVPVTSFLVEHDRGLVLFDTQLDPAAYDRDPSEVFGPVAEMMQLQIKPEQRVDRQVEGLGYRTSDVTHVVVSHLHMDHAGCARLFPEARFYAGPGEMRYAYWPEPSGQGYFRLEDLLPLRNFNWCELDDDHDLFGDGSLLLLHTPGHTPGELSMLVRLADRSIVVSGDTAHMATGLDLLLPMPFNWDTRQSVQSMRKLKRIAEENAAYIWISHELAHYAEMKAPACFGTTGAAVAAGVGHAHPDLPGACVAQGLIGHPQESTQATGEPHTIG